ncbi:MAG TPA: sigma-70 family RNA polymerase sigma factor [Gemmatimonadaceae bacterium]|jgi:RNA polymerase sigma-70 factor (ECF subfamily)|nr:sigma-70 family RNA polymerase sigma factor [Gemmatimonadaceae bacterium]
MYIAYALLCADADGGRGSGPLAELGGTTERELIARLRQGDHDAFAMIYRVFHPRLVAIAEGYVHSAAVAEDLAQDTLLISWDRREQWRDDDSLITYLYATVRNRALKHLRHERVVGRVGDTAIAEGHVLGSAEQHESVADAVESADLQTIVMRAVDRLPAMQRTAFLLRWVHQLEYEEIATIMGIASTAARKHVSRARATLVPIVLRLIR